MRHGDEHSVEATHEHVEKKQHEIAVVKVTHAVVHPRAVMVHLRESASIGVRVGVRVAKTAHSIPYSNAVLVKFSYYFMPSILVSHLIC